VNKNVSFRISRIPHGHGFLASYSRGWRSSWTHYRKNGTFIEFPTWGDAYDFLVKRYNPAFVSLRLCDYIPDTFEKNEKHEIVKVDQKQPGKDTPSLFDFLCDAYKWVENNAPEQIFMFLRGVLFQWCIEHGESVMDMEELFIPDIRYIATQGRN
jgi:hypothetical protein